MLFVFRSECLLDRFHRPHLERFRRDVLALDRFPEHVYIGSISRALIARNRRSPDLVGIPQTHVSAMKRGVKLPTLLTVLRLAAALDCKVGALVSVFDKADVRSILPK